MYVLSLVLCICMYVCMHNHTCGDGGDDGVVVMVVLVSAPNELTSESPRSCSISNKNFIVII